MPPAVLIDAAAHKKLAALVPGLRLELSLALEREQGLLERAQLARASLEQAQVELVELRQRIQEAPTWEGTAWWVVAGSGAGLLLGGLVGLVVGVGVWR